MEQIEGYSQDLVKQTVTQYIELQCTILDQISSVAEGLSPAKTRESCPIPKSPVWEVFFSCKAQIIFLVAIF